MNMAFSFLATKNKIDFLTLDIILLSLILLSLVKNGRFRFTNRIRKIR